MRRFILLFLLVPACALAQSGVWGLRGITRRFVVHGNIVYAVDGRGVAAYDATTLKRLQTIETESESLHGRTQVLRYVDGFDALSVCMCKLYGVDYVYRCTVRMVACAHNNRSSDRVDQVVGPLNTSVPGSRDAPRRETNHRYFEFKRL